MLTELIIVKEYPLDVRAFYTMPSSTPGKSKSYDIICRGQEVLSGAQRIHNHALLRSEMKRRGLDPDGPGLKEYVESFQYATSPHAGGAFGLERIVANWLGLPNIRLASLFPRDPSRLSP
jgi:aspartyl-tRNA synthetase